MEAGETGPNGAHARNLVVAQLSTELAHVTAHLQYEVVASAQESLWRRNSNVWPSVQVITTTQRRYPFLADSIVQNNA